MRTYLFVMLYINKLLNSIQFNSIQWMDGCMDEWMDCVDEWMDGLMDGWMDGSYITNRTYRTLINDIQSDEFQLKYGVPQGSVLGPLLFLIYLRPLSLLISKFPQIKFNIFAYDIIIYQTLPLENNDNSSLINCTNNIRNWLINNNLLLNIDKTQLINISKKLTQNKFPIYLIDNLIVEPSKTVKCLDVTYDLLLKKHFIILVRSKK